MKELMRIRTAYAEPGMIIGKDIYSSTDYLIVGEGTTLTDHMITRLRFYSVDEFFVLAPEESLFKKSTAKSVIKKKSVATREASYVNRVKSSREFKVFTQNFYSSFVSYKEQLNAIVQNKAPINTEHLLKDISKIVATCKSPASLLDMMMAIRNLDDATYVHSMNVALICNLFAHWLKLGEKETNDLTLAGLLHDIGKMLIPTEIIKKPAKLTQMEYHIIKGHPALGYELLLNQNVNRRIALAALQHHERCDGSGYPHGLTSDEIEPYAKIVAIADVYDALTANRVYRGPICPVEVIGILQREGLTVYDTKYLLTFLDQIMYSYLNYTVKLSNGEIGRIILMQRNQLNKPVIALSGDRFIDLREEPDLNIVGVV